MLKKIAITTTTNRTEKKSLNLKDLFNMCIYLINNYLRSLLYT